mmetsp:Transcript_21286/g.67361  ORF Transcript_21286/g.67361 Transcript_21286/m.67361 type:complete len:263 (+) Transcript_21286:1114-1902(+)
MVELEPAHVAPARGAALPLRHGAGAREGPGPPGAVLLLPVVAVERREVDVAAVPGPVGPLLVSGAEVDHDICQRHNAGVLELSQEDCEVGVAPVPAVEVKPPPRQVAVGRGRLARRGQPNGGEAALGHEVNLARQRPVPPPGVRVAERMKTLEQDEVVRVDVAAAAAELRGPHRGFHRRGHLWRQGLADQRVWLHDLWSLGVIGRAEIVVLAAPRPGLAVQDATLVLALPPAAVRQGAPVAYHAAGEVSAAPDLGPFPSRAS